MSIAVKAYFGGEIRRFQAVAGGAAALRIQLLSSFSIAAVAAAQLQLSYADDAADWVTLASDEDLATALSLLAPDAPLRLRLTTPSGVDEAAQLLQHPKVQALIEGLVNETIQKPIFDTMVQDMLPSVVQAMERQGLGYSDKPQTGTRPPASQFQYQRFSELDPQSSVVLPSICLEDTLEEDSGDTSLLAESVADSDGGGRSMDSMIEAMQCSLGSEEDFSLTSVDFSALSAMLEHDLMRSQLLKEKERMLLEHAAEVDSEASASPASSPVEPKPRPDSSSENLATVLQGSPGPLSRSEHAARAAEEIERSFVVMDSSASGAASQYDDGYLESDLLQALVELGFTDVEKNRRLVKVFPNDLPAIVEVLLDYDEATAGK